MIKRQVFFFLADIFWTPAEWLFKRGYHVNWLYAAGYRMTCIAMGWKYETRAEYDERMGRI